MPGAAYTGQLSAAGDPGSPDFDATSVTLATGTGFVGELAQDQSEITEQGNIVTYTQLSASVNGTGVGSINGLSFTATGGLVSVAPTVAAATYTITGTSAAMSAGADRGR